MINMDRNSKIDLSWKKVLLSDLTYVCQEIKDSVDLPAVIILTGEVGTGKTTFCKSFIGDGATQSPTYSIINETKNCVHADFYRIEGPDDIVHLELPLYIENKEYLGIFCRKRSQGRAKK